MILVWGYYDGNSYSSVNKWNKIKTNLNLFHNFLI